MIQISDCKMDDIRDFKLVKKENSHSECNLTISIGRTDHADYFDKLNKTISIDNGDEYIFWGYIDDIVAEKHYSNTLITIHAFSFSKKIDNEKHCRIFQNPKKTLSSIFSYYENKLKIRINLESDEVIEEPILQIEETDFEFLKRIANTYGYSLIVCDNIDSNTITLSIVNKRGLTTKNLEEIPEKLLFHITSEGDNIFKQAILTLNDTYYNIGDIFKIESEFYAVKEFLLFFDKGIYKYTYNMIEKEVPIEKETSNQHKKIILKGIVTNNNDSEKKGRIQVKFDCAYEDADNNEKIWIPFETPYSGENGGIIFLPDINDIVEVVFVNEHFYSKEITGKMPLPDCFDHPDNKYIANIYGKRVVFTKDNLSITSNDAIVDIKDKEILLSVGESQISLTDKRIILKNGNSHLFVSDNVDLKTNNISLKGTEVAIKSEQNTVIKGSNIVLSK